VLFLLKTGFSLSADPGCPAILKMGDYTQPNIFYCGPTAIFLIMDYWGMENTDFSRLVDFLFQKELMGTANSNMVFCPRLFGLKSYSFTGDYELLKRLLQKKIPVIVLQNFSRAVKLGHFRIVVGMDSRKNRILIRDPAKKKIRKMKFSRFSRLWERGNTINNHRWAMILLPEFIDFRDEAIENSVLTELNIGTFYYRHFDYWNAYTAFKEAYKRDGKNTDVLTYFAQVLIRLKNFDESFRVIRELMEQKPEDPVAYDLLGLAFFYTGDYHQALKNLGKAVQLNKNSRENNFIIDHYNLVKTFMEDRDKNEKK
jgi:tetratricopeptide (TPR) repeat protein